MINVINHFMFPTQVYECVIFAVPIFQWVNYLVNM